MNIPILAGIFYMAGVAHTFLHKGATSCFCLWKGFGRSSGDLLWGGFYPGKNISDVLKLGKNLSYIHQRCESV